eukprot:g4813.t1
MFSKLQREGASENEATSGGPSIVAGFPTNATLATGTHVYYNMSPPSCWKRLLVFLRGLIYGFTTLLCCRVNMMTTDDRTWGLRLFSIGSMIGAAITGMLIGFLSTFLGCLIGGEIASCAGDNDDRDTGCTVGGFSGGALLLCFLIIAAVRRLPKPIFQNTVPEATNNNEYAELKTSEEV